MLIQRKRYDRHDLAEPPKPAPIECAKLAHYTVNCDIVHLKSLYNRYLLKHGCKIMVGALLLAFVICIRANNPYHLAAET